MLLATQGVVDQATVEGSLPAGAPAASIVSGSGPLADRVQTFERSVIVSELKRHHNNVTNAAKSLGLERSHLYKKAEQLGIDMRALRNETPSSSEP
jgi:DNA-binding NtrC family response regulator